MIQNLLRLSYSLILLAVSYTDVRRGIVPNKIIYPAILLALGGMLHSPGWQSALLGGAIGAIVFVIPILVYGSERAGMGDVKLGLFIGLILGFPAVIYALIIAFFIGAAAGLIGIALGKLDRKSILPFAPFLAFGAIISLLFTL